jgi:uncharacterized protein YjeT (DUF2065 family)
MRGPVATTWGNGESLAQRFAGSFFCPGAWRRFVEPMVVAVHSEPPPRTCGGGRLRIGRGLLGLAVSGPREG